MSVNDKDMDVLLRRYVNAVTAGSPDGGHLDADELNAFAEGALPMAARQRYVSHLADCDRCRKLAGELVVVAGGAVPAHVPALEPVAEPWWRKFTVMFAPPALRYAAFALVLVAVVGISFMVWRRPTPRNADLLAQNEPQATPVQAVQPATSQTPARNGESQPPAATTVAPHQTVEPNADQNKAAAVPGIMPPPPPPKPVSEVDERTALAGRADTTRAQASPSYAPPPPTDNYRVSERSREQSNETAPSGPRRSEYEKYKAIDRASSGDVAKQRGEDRALAANQPAAKENKDDSRATTRTSSGVVELRGRVVQQESSEVRKSENTVVTEETPTRSAGGRKFKRQGNAWVDSKLKSSMPVRNVARGSEEFDKLDSGLRSIAQQLGGEIVVVWKGKAYRIK